MKVLTLKVDEIAYIRTKITPLVVKSESKEEMEEIWASFLAGHLKRNGFNVQKKDNSDWEQPIKVSVNETQMTITFYQD